MTDKTAPAFPNLLRTPKTPKVSINGLTKREYAAIAAMQGILAAKGHGVPESIADTAVRYADALLAELEKDNG